MHRSLLQVGSTLVDTIVDSYRKKSLGVSQKKKTVGVPHLLSKFVKINKSVVTVKIW